MMLNWEKFGIDPGKIRGGKGFCPKCHHTRKHRTDRSLSVDVHSGMFNCHNCGFRGSAIEIEKKKEFSRPVPRLEKVSQKVIQFFEKRGISNNTLLRFKITEANEWMPQVEKEVTCVCFNYFRGEELVNIKFRGRGKMFKMAKDAELIFYNLNAIESEKTAVIVEGEMDCLAMHESGIYNVVSVPNGASKGNQRLEYLDHCWTAFEQMDKIILAVDGDEAGISLRDELARRLGKERCWTVAYPEGCKDANDVLIKRGKEEVKNLVLQAREWPLEGIMTMETIYPVIGSWYVDGYPKGAKAHIPGFDELLKFAPGQLTIVTGIPGHGKDEFCNWIQASLAKHEEWPWGICGFEETPPETVSKLIEKLTGKAFAFRRDPAERISVEDFEYGIGMVDKYFSFFNTEEIETDIDGIIGVAEMLVIKKGIKGLVLNPWNWIEHNRPPFMSETEYVSLVLSKIIRFAKKRGVHVLLIAHTTKMLKDKKTGKYEVPTLYSISGSANFYNKTHNGITVYRDYKTNVVDVYVQKVKQSWLGQIGFVTYNFNTHTRQYLYQGTSLNPQVPSVQSELGNGNWRPVADLEPEKKHIDEVAANDLPF